MHVAAMLHGKCTALKILSWALVHMVHGGMDLAPPGCVFVAAKQRVFEHMVEDQCMSRVSHLHCTAAGKVWAKDDFKPQQQCVAS